MKKIRIVAIDDVGDILDLIEYNLTKEGMEISTFTDSTEALASIANNPPDLILSDWMMPSPNGIEVCRAVKNSPSTSNIPIIMLTCKAQLENHKEAIDAGAEDYLVKPVRMTELVRRVKLALPA